MIIKQFKHFFMASAVVMLTACGGGTSTDTELTAKELAFQKIETYAENGQIAPSLQDYIDVGVVGITVDNLADINEVVETLIADDVDTTEEIQALADELGVVLPDTTDPVFTSSATASVNENQTSAITLVATDNESAVVYSISGTDVGDFTVDAGSGVVTFSTAPDFETKESYVFTATATDASSNAATQEVTITIVDICEVSSVTITHNGTDYKEVCSPYTGKVWLDRNLGAAQVCTAFNDPACYGDYYQWGRNFDGHEDSISGTTNVQATDVNNAGSDFITDDGTNSFDWAKTADSDGSLRSANWSKTDGSSVCPVGFRVPTLTELQLEILHNSMTTKNTAFTNFPRLPSAGGRYYFDGSVGGVGSWGGVWSSSAGGSFASGLYLYWSDADWSSYGSRAHGRSVRCLRD